jgi:hypothetical protein
VHPKVLPLVPTPFTAVILILLSTTVVLTEEVQIDQASGEGNCSLWGCGARGISGCESRSALMGLRRECEGTMLAGLELSLLARRRLVCGAGNRVHWSVRPLRPTKPGEQEIAPAGICLRIIVEVEKSH